MKTREQLVEMAKKYRVAHTRTEIGRLSFNDNPKDFARKILKIKKGQVRCTHYCDFVIYIDINLTDNEIRENIYSEIQRRRKDKKSYKVYEILENMKNYDIKLEDIKKKNEDFCMGVDL